MTARPLGAVQIGQRVQRHAFPGMPYRPALLGTITAAHGHTVRVQADNGDEYDVQPTELVPAGRPWPGAARCSCCPRTPRQLELFT